MLVCSSHGGVCTVAGVSAVAEVTTVAGETVACAVAGDLGAISDMAGLILMT